MKPLLRRIMPSAYFINKYDPGQLGPGSVSGQVKRENEIFPTSFVCLYNKHTLLPVAIKTPDETGIYNFYGLNKNQKYFLIAFDRDLKYNSVIQDYIVPK